MKILLLCSLGLSSSLLVGNMKKSLTQIEQDWIIEARSISLFDEISKDYDLIFIAPQYYFRKKELLSKCSESEVILEFINPHVYKYLEGNELLKRARYHRKEKENQIGKHF